MNSENKKLDLTNTVVANNQIKSKRYVRFGEKSDGYPKILFAGNSMSWHAPKSDIGWSGDWGMAASKAENDYVHQTIEILEKKYSDVSYCIAQCAYWEVNMNTNVFDEYKPACEYMPDVLVMILGENINEGEHTQDELSNEFIKLIKFLTNNRKDVLVLMSKPFLWEKSIVSAAIDKAADTIGAIVMDMSALADDLSMRAIGKFGHSGVEAHPGDKGMHKIAEIIAERIEGNIKDKKINPTER